MKSPRSRLWPGSLIVRSMSDSDQFRPAERHGPIREVFPDIFMVTGDISLGRGFRIKRNMVILRHDGDLTLVNSVRLTPKGETKLEALGTVKHLVRLGNYHGMDDAYYKDRYGAQFWCQEGTNNTLEPAIDTFLTETCTFPDPRGTVLTFALTKSPEAVLYIGEKALLITCDSFQYYENRRGFSLLAQIMMPFLGFGKGVVVGPVWLKAMTPEGGSLEHDFRRILDLPFKHLISGHGQVCMDTAHEQAEAEVERVFG